MLTLKEFKEARAVLSGVILNTSLVYSKAFSRATGNQVYIKPENMQVTGAYKIRGAYYKISTLSEEEKARGLVTASAGCCGWPPSWPGKTAISSSWSTTSSSISTARAAWSCG